MKLLALKDGVKMSGLSDPYASSIWDFALVWYQGADVEADCLVAQETYGLDVTALIYALYRARLGQGFDAGMAVELARTLSARIIEPLRATRIALKSMPRLVDPHTSALLRQSVKAAELDAERLTLNALAGLKLEGAARSYEASLLAIASASQVQVNSELSALLKRLALAAQNM